MDSQPEPSNTPLPSAPAKPPRVWTVALAFMLALGVIMVVGSAIVGIAVTRELLRTGGNLQDPAAVTALLEQLKFLPWVLVAGAAVSSTTFICTALLGGTLSPQPLRERLRLQAGASLPAWAWGVAVVGCIALGQALESLSILTGVWQWTTALKVVESSRQAPAGLFALLLLFGAVGAGTGEELFFRGYMQTRLVQRWGRVAGLAVSATVFGLIHMDPIHTPIALVLGVFLGWLAERTGSVRLPIVVHVLNNATSFLLTRYVTPFSQMPASANLSLVVGCSLLVVGAIVLLRRTGTSPGEARTEFASS